MKKVFVDLEMHPVESRFSSQKKISKLETIEIGAVMLDEDNREIASFCEYVKPAFCSTIYPKYEKLTGISYDMVEHADGFEMVMSRFLAWCGEDYTVYSWSLSDLEQVEKESLQKEVVDMAGLSFAKEHWKDYQNEFGKVLGISRKLKLTDAVEIGGLDFDGRAHDGLVDARNTANLYRRAQDRAFVEKLGDIIGAEEEKETLSFSMGSIFDFGKLRLAAGM